MAEQSQADRKSQLIAELERSRSDLARDLRGVRHGLDVGAHLRHAFVRQKAAWLGGAALTGWLLSRLPSRRKAVPRGDKPLAGMPKPKQSERGGLLLAALGVAGTILKPAITALATRKIKEFAASRDGRGYFRQPAGR